MNRRAACLLALTASACSAPTVRERPTAEAPQTTYFVDPSGNDDRGNGSRDAPFRSIAAALLPEFVERIVVSPGSYPEPDLVITRPVEIFGPGDHKATLLGHVSIESDGVLIHGIDVDASIAAQNSSRVTIEALTVRSSSRADALRIEASGVRLSDVSLECGKESCLHVQNSTVSAERLIGRPSAESKRVIRVVSSSASISRLEIAGGGISQVQAEQGARLQLNDAKLESSQGNALVALSGSTITGHRVMSTKSKDTALLVSASEVDLVSCEFSTTGDGLTVGIQGSKARLQDVAFTGSVQGTMSVGSYRSLTSSVEVIGGQMNIGFHPGPSVTHGSLTLRGTRLLGVEESQVTNDAIIASSESASLTLENVSITAATGWGVSVHGSASISGREVTIERPRQGGILVDESPGARVQLESLVVTGARTLSAVALFGVLDADLQNVTLSGSADAGLIVGDGAHVAVRDSHFESNQRYGLAAFGNSTIDVQGSVVRGSMWAAFASCGDGSEIVDLGGNTLEGETSLCR